MLVAHARAVSSAAEPRILRRTWARLDAPERVAWRAWREVGDQVQLLQQAFEKREDAVFVLDFSAVTTWLMWIDCPRTWRQRVWAGVQVLHDLHRHRGRFHQLHPELCFHADDPLRLVDTRMDRRLGDRKLPNCPRCARRWRCTSCDMEFVFHQH